MATQSPFSLAAQAIEHLGASLTPPTWLQDETLNRVLLFVNHVLMQEPEAMRRLARQTGQRIQLQWQRYTLQISPTPAGLFERVNVQGFDLNLTVTDQSPLDIASAWMRGEKPNVRIEGDVRLAAEVNWLIDHVRWDAEEDLARLIGDAPAHALAQCARSALAAMRQFIAQRRPSPNSQSKAAS